MCKYIYHLLSSSKLAKIDLFNTLETAKKYEKVVTNDENLFSKPDQLGKCIFSDVFCDLEAPLFVRMNSRYAVGPYSNAEIHCVFYQNLFLTFTYDAKSGDRVIRAHMKRPGDVWEFERLDTSDGCDLLNPLNVCAEVYNAYDVNVQNLTRARGENYISGTWNKMFYNTLNSFLEKVDEYTEVTRLNKAYKKKNDN